MKPETHPFVLRPNHELHECVDEVARRNHRSTHSQYLHAIEHGLSEEPEYARRKHDGSFDRKPKHAHREDGSPVQEVRRARGPQPKPWIRTLRETGDGIDRPVHNERQADPADGHDETKLSG